MLVFRLVDGCEGEDADAASSPSAAVAVAPAPDDFSYPLPRPMYAPNRGSYRGMFNSATVQQLASSADSGAAIASANGAAALADSGAPRGGSIVPFFGSLLLLGLLVKSL